MGWFGSIPYELRSSSGCAVADTGRVMLEVLLSRLTSTDMNLQGVYSYTIHEVLFK